MDASELSRRLDRFDKRLDELSKAMAQMARTEERVATILDQNATLFNRLSRLEDRIISAELINATQGKSLGFFERMGWAVVSLVCSVGSGVVVWFVKGGSP